MEDGLIQLLVIGIFILISIADAIAKRKKGRGADTEDETVRSSVPLPEYTRPHGMSDGDEEEEGESTALRSSESMVPDELWEEISQLARGERRQPDRAPAAPPEVGGLPAEIDESRLGRMTRASSGMPKLQRPPSYDERALARQARGQPLIPDEPTEQIAPVPGSGGTVPKRGSRHWLSTEGSGAAALRRAVVIREVLGPPLALRKGGAPGEE